MATKPKAEAPNCGPVTVAIPNTSEVKMAAILTLAESNLELAKALNSTNTQVNIHNCHIAGTETGINIQHAP